MQNIKDQRELAKKLEGAGQGDLESGIVLVSGSDQSIFDVVLEQIKGRLKRNVGEIETTSFSGEPGDSARFQEELFNIPLFAPYRLFVVRQAHEVLRHIIQDNQAGKTFAEELTHIPDRTFIALQYDGAPGKKLTNMLGPRALHFSTREIYPNQLMDAIRETAKKLHLRLSDEAAFEIRERVEPKSGAIEMALRKLKLLVDESKHENIGAAEVREYLFPNPGYNPFTLVDAVFAGDFRAFEREMLQFNPAVDNLFVILKLLLNRADELRRAGIAKTMGMREGELSEFLGHKHKPPFIQKRILQRVAFEVDRFDSARLSEIYDFLITTQREFRGKVPAGRQALVFQERVLRIFFGVADEIAP